MAYDLKINTVSVKTYASVVSWDGVFAGAPLRGGNLTIPGVAGGVWQPKVRNAYVFSVPLVLLGSSEADFQDKLTNLRNLVNSAAAALAVTRTRPTGLGDVTEACTADYADGLEPAAVNLLNGRVVLSLTNLSGGWT